MLQHPFFFFTVYLILLARAATSRIGKTTTTQRLFRLPILAMVLQMSGRFTLDKFCFYDSRAPQISCCRILNGCFWYVVHMAYIYERHPLVRCIYSLSTYWFSPLYTLSFSLSLSLILSSSLPPSLSPRPMFSIHTSNRLFSEVSLFLLMFSAHFLTICYARLIQIPSVDLKTDNFFMSYHR